MKTKKYTAIIAENYYEQQFLMARFPSVYWRHEDGTQNIMFYIPENNRLEIELALEDWRKRVAK